MDADEGLGTSLLVYVGALLGALGLILWPVYYANEPIVLDNVNSATVHEILAPRSDNFPLALLKHNDIVTPATLATLDAKLQDGKSQHVTAVSHRTAPRARTENSVAGLMPERPARSFFPFSLF
jgi:hypothetical protein